MAAGRHVYFAGLFSPNEGEEGQSIEFAVLQWDLPAVQDGPEASSKPPFISIHTFISPRVPTRIRWGIVGEQGIDPVMLRKKAAMFPTEKELCAENYLKNKDTVIFDGNREIMHELVRESSSVEEISTLWQEIFGKSSDEALRTASTLDEMLSCLHFPTVAEIAASTKHYTVLLLKLFASATLWSVLRYLKTHPEKTAPALSSSLPMTGLWPMPEAPEIWFEGEHKNLASFPTAVIEKFFSRNTQDYIDWRRTCIYLNDWNYRRSVITPYSSRDLPDAVELCEFVFNRRFDLSMQLWVLMYYSVFSHKKDYAVQVAVHDGNFDTMPDPVREDFTGFLLTHLQDFLSAKQKSYIISAIVGHMMQERSKLSFEHYDFEALREEQRGHGSQGRFFFRQEPVNSAVHFYEEIAGGDHVPLYRRYMITGRGDEREIGINGVNRFMRKFMDEVRDPFSAFWTTPDTRRWVQCITGIKWKDIARQPRIHEESAVTAIRSLITDVIVEQSAEYINELKRRLIDIINRINGGADLELSERFCFMGVSVEVTVTPRSQTPLIQRIFKFH